MKKKSNFVGMNEVNCFVVKTATHEWYGSASDSCNDCSADFCTFCKCSAVCGAYALHARINQQEQLQHQLMLILLQHNGYHHKPS